MEKKVRKRIPRKASKKENYPGYPHYPANEDITYVKNSTGIEIINDDTVIIPETNNIPKGKNMDEITGLSSAEEENIVNNVPDDTNEEVKIIMGTEADLTDEDLKLLELTDQNIDSPDAINLLHASLDNEDEEGLPLNEKDFDIPGSELDDANEKIGEEDEENNYYSLGGDNHESLEEDNA